MKQFQDLMKYVVENGVDTNDRTNVGTLRVIVPPQLRFDLSKGFPAPTTKNLAFLMMKAELLWFMEGSTNERRLAEIRYGKDRSELTDKTTIWTENALNQAAALGYTDGELGAVYGKQFRAWDTFIETEPGKYVKGKPIDQIEVLIDGLKNNPYGRRHIINLWNVAELDKMALPPCHCYSQFFVVDGKLSCHLHMRSTDVFLGLPFNIASYSLLTHMLAQVCGLEVGEFIWTGGDVHVYKNHMEAIATQLSRVPGELPTLWIDPTITDINDFTMDSFKLIDYNPQGTIPAPMAV